MPKSATRMLRRRPHAEHEEYGDYGRRYLRRPSHKYSVGNTQSVNSVLVMTPPITTVANGRCTSAPADVLVAIGTNPTLATKAVIRIVRRHWLPACKIPVDSRIIGTI